MKHSLLHTMGNQYTGFGGSVVDQHSTNILGEIKEISPLHSIYLQSPFKVHHETETKESTEALSSPLL